MEGEKMNRCFLTLISVPERMWVVKKFMYFCLLPEENLCWFSDVLRGERSSLCQTEWESKVWRTSLL